MRPLVAIAPTAIALGMPINTQLPFNDPGRLADTLLASAYRDKVFAFHISWNDESAVCFDVRKQSYEDLPEDCPAP